MKPATASGPKQAGQSATTPLAKTRTAAPGSVSIRAVPGPSSSASGRRPSDDGAGTVPTGLTEDAVLQFTLRVADADGLYHGDQVPVAAVAPNAPTITSWATHTVKEAQLLSRP